MANPLYAPEFRVEINDEAIPAALRASITGVSFQTGLEGADRVELSLVNESLRWLDHPLLHLGNPLRLALGYAPAPLEQMFVGEIVGHTASFPASGTPALTVVAQDRVDRLQRGTKARWFDVPVEGGTLAQLDPAVIDTVARESGLVPLIEPVGAALKTLLGESRTTSIAGDPDAGQKVVRHQVRESDFDFLTRIARDNGWEMFIDHQGPEAGYRLRFQSLLDRLTPEMTLEYGRSLIDFAPRLSNVGEIESASTYVWLPALKQTYTVTVSWDWDRQTLALDVQPTAVPAEEPAADYLVADPVTLESAPRAILGELLPRLNRRLTGSGSTIGNPGIRAGTVLRLEGLGEQFGGLYRVTSASHSLDTGGYQTSFEVRKEIWFGSIPLPEQGAVPVTVAVPLAI